jgi:hypothetical protein
MAGRCIWWSGEGRSPAVGSIVVATVGITKLRFSFTGACRTTAHSCPSQGLVVPTVATKGNITTPLSPWLPLQALTPPFLCPPAAPASVACTASGMASYRYLCDAFPRLDPGHPGPSRRNLSNSTSLRGTGYGMHFDSST